MDGRQVTAEEDETILDAAVDAGISIPTLCHLQGLSNVGACRMCLTEVKGSSKLPRAWKSKPTRSVYANIV